MIKNGFLINIACHSQQVDGINVFYMAISVLDIKVVSFIFLLQITQ